MISIKHYFQNLPVEQEALEALAEEFNVSLHGTYSGSPQTGKLFDNYEAQRRIQQAIDHARGAWLWLIALISAFGSTISALAAWFAVISK